MTNHPRPKLSDITIRLLSETDLPVADRILRLAFGTYLGLPDPLQFLGDADYIRTRWLADPSAILGAELDGELVGSISVTRWGTVGFFGPLTIRPDLWDRGIAQLLLEPTIDLFDKWGVRHAGLFTFPASTKHVNLYQKFGFWPRFLTALMEIELDSVTDSTRWSQFSKLSDTEKMACIQACRQLTNSICDGLDLAHEINAVDKQKLGDNILIWKGERLSGFAVCHVGAGTEAGSGKCYVKFGAVAPGPDAPTDFHLLIDACCEFGASRGARTLTTGVNTSHLDAYREMLKKGFRITRQGIAMHRHNDPGYHRPDVFLIDDWR